MVQHDFWSLYCLFIIMLPKGLLVRFFSFDFCNVKNILLLPWRGTLRCLAKLVFTGIWTKLLTATDALFLHLWPIPAWFLRHRHLNGVFTRIWSEAYFVPELPLGKSKSEELLYASNTFGVTGSSKNSVPVKIKILPNLNLNSVQIQILITFSDACQVKSCGNRFIERRCSDSPV